MGVGKSMQVSNRISRKWSSTDIGKALKRHRRHLSGGVSLVADTTSPDMAVGGWVSLGFRV